MISEFIVNETDTLQRVLQIIDDSSGGVALLVDRTSGVLQRVITDGDIRRAFLKGDDSDSCLDCLPAHKPVVVHERENIDRVRSLMKEHSIVHIPVVNDAGLPVGLYRRDELEENVLLSPPHLGTDEMTYVTEAIETNWVAPVGPNLDRFEKEFAVRVGSKSAAAVSSGTAALHLSLILSGIKRGDRVACSSFTFVASVNPVMYQGGEPVFIDSEPDGWNMCPKALEMALLAGKNDGKPIKAVIAVNLYGQSARIEKISELCENFGAILIEDSAESLGATYRGQSSGTFGKFGIFSFNGNKIITTSGGGMLVSDDVEAIDRAKFLATQAREPAGFYQHKVVGYNYRLSNILAGIGRAQLSVLSERVESRRKIFDNYVSDLEGLGIEWMPELNEGYSTRWLSVGCLPPDTNLGVEAFLDHLLKRGIEARRVWKPMHLQPLFTDCSFFSHSVEDFSGSLFERGFCLPSGSSLSQNQQQRVIAEIRDYLS
ncbi:MAG: DegT/DnrJ/EryC1/StrS family aminotransferase [Verrucomicrobiales bacterium]|nr:DegT/DnrJ/EryC1/StrS family aminotransferase [Verrucomicrobiales bacterium]